jgi:hypothetical protein
MRPDKIPQVAGHESAISPAARGGQRLLLQPDQAGPTLLDGGWWPRSDDPGTELPGLILALDKGHDPITRVLLHASAILAAIGPQAGAAAPPRFS